MRIDPLSPAQRRERMSRIRSKDTKPELTVRRLVHAAGYRYRLQAKDLPGKPDLVFRSRRKVILVHGCFWHQHGCDHYRMPKTRREFWLPKLEKNVERDQRILTELTDLGWSCLVIWECELKNLGRTRARLLAFLEDG